MGSLGWSRVPARGPWLCRGTATHQVALPEQSRAPRQSNPGCNTGLLLGSLQHPHGLGRTRVSQGETQPALLGTSPRAVQQQESSGCPAGMIGSGAYVSCSRP